MTYVSNVSNVDICINVKIIGRYYNTLYGLYKYINNGGSVIFDQQYLAAMIILTLNRERCE